MKKLREDAAIKMKKTEKSYGGWWFLLIVILIYIIVALFSFKNLISSFSFVSKILIKVLPVLVFVFLLMSIINYFANNKTLLNWLGKEAGLKGWIVSILGGIISIGPIYMWYPLLSDLKEKNVRTAFLATFLYNRAIKPALFPLLILYFGIVYTVVLTVVMAVISIFQGFIVEKIVEVRK